MGELSGRVLLQDQTLRLCLCGGGGGWRTGKSLRQTSAPFLSPTPKPLVSGKASEKLLAAPCEAPPLALGVAG